MRGSRTSTDDRGGKHGEGEKLNKIWAQNWIEMFAGRTDELLECYADEFEFEDVNLAVKIRGDKTALRAFFLNFASNDSADSYNRFNVFDYVGDDITGVVHWIWEAGHAGDFLGLPAAGFQTSTRGMTVLEFSEGKIVRECAIWDALPVLRQIGAIPSL